MNYFVSVTADLGSIIITNGVGAIAASFPNNEAGVTAMNYFIAGVSAASKIDTVYDNKGQCLVGTLDELVNTTKH